MGNIRKSFSGNDLLRRQQRIDNEISEKAIAKLNTTMEEVLSDIKLQLRNLKFQIEESEEFLSFYEIACGGASKSSLQ